MPALKGHRLIYSLIGGVLCLSAFKLFRYITGKSQFEDSNLLVTSAIVVIGAACTYLLLDVDNTTVASKGDALPSQRVIEAVKRASGLINISLATGRPYDLTENVIKSLGLSGPGVFNGGAEIVEMSTGKILNSQTLDIPTQQQLLRLAKPFGYPIYNDEDQYSKPLSLPDDVRGAAAKLFIEAVKTSDAIHILEQLNGVPDAEAHPTTSWEDGDVVDIHITHQLATKLHGAQQLINMLGLTKDQVIAVGDGHNDIPLLEAAGLKVAVGNAPDEVKQLADYVAPSLQDDGVADVIEKFVDIELT